MTPWGALPGWMAAGRSLASGATGDRMGVTWMVWGLRVGLLVVTLGAAGVAALVLTVIVRPVVAEARRARAAGDWWLPFLPDGAGGWGPLVDNHWWSGMRARERGGASGLVVRWGFWVLMSVLLVAAMGSLTVSAVRLLVHSWP